MAGLLAGLDAAEPYIQTGLNYLIQKDAAKRQARENRKLAEYQNEANSKFIQSQNAYNTPSAQMARFKDAGLNPNLIYGQGTPGNQSSSQQAASVRETDYQSMAANVLPNLNASKMVQAQTQAIDAKIAQTNAQTALTNLQAQVTAANPLLNKAGFDAIIDSLKSSAEIKAADSKIRGQEADFKTRKEFRERKDANGNDVLDNTSAGWRMMETQMNLLDQKFNLGNQDAAIKAEVINSKEFQNELLEIQRNWMKNGDITPQHILQFIQLLLMKMLQR